MNVIFQGMHQKFFQYSRTIVHIGQWAFVGIVLAYSLGTPFLLQAKITLNSMTKEQAVKLGEDFGIIVGEVDEEIREFLGLEQAEGVVVFEVIGGKPAALAGIKPRALIKEIDSIEISTLEDFGRALEAAMTTENFSLVTYESNERPGTFHGIHIIIGERGKHLSTIRRFPPPTIGEGCH
jgi:membrane-associated protease RseP (regulator of RpoE activity)